jgi:hypothetical protein
MLDSRFPDAARFAIRLFDWRVCAIASAAAGAVLVFVSTGSSSEIAGETAIGQ